MKAEGGVTCPARVMSIWAFVFNFGLRQSQSPPKQHGCQPLQAWLVFPPISSSNVEKNSFSEENTEEADGASNNLSVESNNQADLVDQA